MTLSTVSLKLPWSLTEDPYLQVKENDGDILLLEEDYDSGAMCNLTPEQAAYVVRAVNAHEALVEAVRFAAVQLRAGADNADGREYAHKACMRALQIVDGVE